MCEARRVVVKVGSSTLTEGAGRVNRGLIARLVEELAALRHQGHDVLLVTSGAIRAGTERLGYQRRPKTIPEKQAAAAVGQGLLMKAYSEEFADRGIVVGQVLLTRDDFSDRSRYLNARNTLFALLKLGAVPIANENDTVAVEEIRVGDNDTLAALLASACDATHLILLSDVDGLMDAEGRVVAQVPRLSPEISALAGGPGSPAGTGGMRTKLSAARMANMAGVEVYIANGRKPGLLARLLEGEALGTHFHAQSRVSSRKHWLAFGKTLRGAVVVNEGARERILQEGKSLLPSGIVSLEGDFAAGDLISLRDARGKEIARGLANYAASEVGLILGHQTRDIESLLGRRDVDEVVHRDNLVLRQEALERLVGS
ncbi:MAG TPA: glutamate 5-kinase [Armatimonadota bacterium]